VEAFCDSSVTGSNKAGVVSRGHTGHKRHVAPRSFLSAKSCFVPQGGSRILQQDRMLPTDALGHGPAAQRAAQACVRTTDHSIRTAQLLRLDGDPPTSDILVCVFHLLGSLLGL
jgi:hypothetical protein